MFFRNLSFFRFPVSVHPALSKLSEHLAEFPLRPLGPLEMTARGFVSPFGPDSEALVLSVGDCTWLCLGSAQRLLPAAVVNAELAERAGAIEAREGRRLGSKARQRLKEDVLHELLPRAFVRPSRTNAYLDLEHNFIAIDSASRKAAETVVSEVRRALGSFPALPLNAETSTRVLLTSWIAGEPMPDGLELGDECELRDPADRGAVVKCQRQELVGAEIGKHLEAGKQCTRLALHFRERLSFVLSDDLVVRKLKFLDGAVQSLEDSERDTLAAELDARFALMSGEIKSLFAMLERIFRISRVDA